MNQTEAMTPTTHNLDEIASLAPFYASRARVWSRVDGLDLSASQIMAVLNEWLTLRAYRDRAERIRMPKEAADG